MGARAITQRRGLRHAAVQGVATAPGRKDRVLLSVQPADWSVGLFASLTLVGLTRPSNKMAHPFVCAVSRVRRVAVGRGRASCHVQSRQSVLAE